MTDEAESWLAHRRLVTETLRRLEEEMDLVFEKLDKMRDEDRVRLEAQAKRISELEKASAVANAKTAIVFGIAGAAIASIGSLLPKLLGG